MKREVDFGDWVSCEVFILVCASLPMATGSISIAFYSQLDLNKIKDFSRGSFRSVTEPPLLLPRHRLWDWRIQEESSFLLEQKLSIHQFSCPSHGHMIGIHICHYGERVGTQLHMDGIGTVEDTSAMGFWAIWHAPLISASQRQVDLWVQGQPGL